MTIEEAEKGGYLSGHQLSTDSQDVKETLNYLGFKNGYERWQGLFCKVLEGDFTSVYGFAGTVPYNNKELHKLK